MVIIYANAWARCSVDRIGKPSRPRIMVFVIQSNKLSLEILGGFVGFLSFEGYWFAVGFLLEDGFLLEYAAVSTF